MSGFQQVLIIQALRPDRLVSSMQLFAQRALGVRELSPPIVNLKRLYQVISRVLFYNGAATNAFYRGVSYLSKLYPTEPP